MDKLLFWRIVQTGAPAIGLCFSIWATVKIHYIDKLSKEKTALEGKLTAKDSIVKESEYVTLLFGGSKIRVVRKTLINGLPYDMLKRNLSIEDVDFKIKLSEKHKLLLSATFRSRDGKYTARIIDNKWRVNDNNFFERNYDANGLEVTDQEGITRVQIELVDQSTIKLKGIFVSGDLLYYLDDNSFSNGYKNAPFSEIKQKCDAIPLIFKYPATDFFGKRVK